MRFTKDHALKANAMCQDTLESVLGIRFHVDETGLFCGTMPVEARSKQPMGLLHGGATAALAESLGSMASAMLVDLDRQGIVGLEVNANHLKGVRNGKVTATAEAVHLGRTTHVWNISIRNEAGDLCAVCRMTNLVLDQR